MSGLEIFGILGSTRLLLNFSKYQKKISLKYLVGLSVAVLFGTLFFGLRPKDFNFSNDVTWITEQPGIRFSEFCIAYTDPIKELSKEKDFGESGFSVEIVLKPASYHEDGFSSKRLSEVLIFSF
ncbi:MAG: hypothetical protein JRF39_07730 [Deltaproteobacteria bacterium]|jgi:hypothetical protein|nr:hypothetical protein [Deltaproteobacteria bacterium]